MKLFSYVIYDEVHEQILFPACAPNDSVVIRENCHALYALNRDFEKEYTLFCTGYFDTRDLDENKIPTFFAESSRVVAWDSYESFHTIVDQMTAQESKALQLQRNGITVKK